MEKEVGVVVPVFNEEILIKTFHDQLYSVMNTLSTPWAILYVNDGSTDQTLSILKEIQKNTRNVNILDLSKNHGQITAIKAGIDYIGTKSVVVIDADFEQPPEVIPKMLEKWEEGYQVVNAVYVDNRPFSFDKIFGQAFYKVISWINPNVPVYANHFFLLGSDVINEIKKEREHNVFFRELLATIGFEQVTINYHRQERMAGITKWGFWKKWNYAISAIMGSTTFPLKMPLYFGGFLVVLSMVLWVVKHKTLSALLLFLGGLNFIFLGIIGEYLAHVFLQSRNRPLYYVKKHYVGE